MLTAVVTGMTTGRVRVGVVGMTGSVRMGMMGTGMGMLGMLGMVITGMMTGW